MTIVSIRLSFWRMFWSRTMRGKRRLSRRRMNGGTFKRRGPFTITMFGRCTSQKYLRKSGWSWNI
jgi:hypothetical protein